MILHGFIHRLVDNRMVPCRCRGVLLYHAECAGFVKMEISASGIFRVEPFQHRLGGDSPSTDGGNVPRPAAGGKRVDTCGFHPLVNHPFPLRVWRRLPTCDRCETGERQSGYRCVGFVKYSQFTDSVLLHIRTTLLRARHNRAAQYIVC